MSVHRAATRREVSLLPSMGCGWQEGQSPELAIIMRRGRQMLFGTYRNPLLLPL